MLLLVNIVFALPFLGEVPEDASTDMMPEPTCSYLGSGLRAREINFT